MTRRPCLEEEWFIKDTLTQMEGLCPFCKNLLEKEILFGKDVPHALSEVYTLSRAIRVKRFMEGNTNVHISNWAFFETMEVINHMTGIASLLLYLQKNLKKEML